MSVSLCFSNLKFFSSCHVKFLKDVIQHYFSFFLYFFAPTSLQLYFFFSSLHSVGWITASNVSWFVHFWMLGPKSCWHLYIEYDIHWGVWMAQLVGPPILGFGTSHDLWVVGLSPTMSPTSGSVLSVDNKIFKKNNQYDKYCHTSRITSWSHSANQYFILCLFDVHSMFYWLLDLTNYRMHC